MNNNNNNKHQATYALSLLKWDRMDRIHCVTLTFTPSAHLRANMELWDCLDSGMSEAYLYLWGNIYYNFWYSQRKSPPVCLYF